MKNQKNNLALSIRNTVLTLTEVTEDELRNKYYLKDNRAKGNIAYHYQKSKRIRLASQMVNYFLIHRLKLTSYEAAYFSFRKHPTPLVATKKIIQELQYPSSRREDIKKIINEFNKKYKFINTFAEIKNVE